MSQRRREVMADSDAREGAVFTCIKAVSEGGDSLLTPTAKEPLMTHHIYSEAQPVDVIQPLVERMGPHIVHGACRGRTKCGIMLRGSQSRSALTIIRLMSVAPISRPRPGLVTP